MSAAAALALALLGAGGADAASARATEGGESARVRPSAGTDSAASHIAQGADSAARQAKFVELLRTYPERTPADTFAQVEALLAQGPFEDRARAEYWLASARLAAGDRTGARDWFARLGREAPGSVWVERSLLGQADAFAQEGDYGAALDWYARAQQASDPAVRELGRISGAQAQVLRARQRWAFGCAAFAGAVALWLFWSWRKGGGGAKVPTELRVVWPVLAVTALLSLRTDPAPRAAILELCASGAAFTWLSGVRLRAAAPRGLAKAAHVALVLSALAATFWAVVYRADLAGMVLETLRAGPE